MAVGDGGEHGQVRLAELLASVSLATDIGTGQPPGHALRTCVIATALAESLGCGADDIRTVHHATLLRFLGCTSDAAETAAMAGGDDVAFNAAMAPAINGHPWEIARRLVRAVGAGRPPVTRLRLIAGAFADADGARRSLTTHCEVGSMLARRIGVTPPVVDALAHAYERWDGSGFPGGLAGDAIPLPVRIFVVARDADVASRLGDEPLGWLRTRRGRAYDPAVVDAFERVGPRALADLDGADEWEAGLAAEPEPVATIDPGDLDGVLLAFADFVDLKSPWTRGHSRRVAELAEAAGRHAGLDGADCDLLRRAALVHDLGRVGVENGVWDKPGALTTAERERMRLHPYFTERILDRCTPLAALRQAAASHHERSDGSGYHRSLPGESLSTAARILAAADVLAALTADRPHRPAHSRDEAARMLEGEAGAALDAGAVACVLAAAGARPAPRQSAWPAGLTDREVEVLRLIARGASNRAVAEQLYISTKTVGRHIENLYRKIGVSSRAAAAVFAMDHRLLG
ncbi:MAG: HD domain-containing phosphohydrolase [Acidimicrobiia bacterium]